MHTRTPQPIALNQPALRRSRGLTLIEACTVMAVGCTLLGLAAPNLTTYGERRDVEAVSAQMRTTLARTIAMLTGQSADAIA